MPSINTSFQSLGMTHPLHSAMKTCQIPVVVYVVLIRISVEEVFDALITINPNKASGMDNIGPSILKNSASILSKPLHYLYSLSLSSGIIPIG